ncbi:Rv1733c family protein, partial [Streptomyces longispororuber]|uniref:Rv1733c family protein n=1 Tax=Streptomyces longispororuber TaxID=68230 RepID=UPI004032E3D2
MRSRVLCWRWRRGPLRRRSDVIEAWTVLVTGVVLFVGAPAAGVTAGAAVHERAEEAARAAHATRHRVTATLTADAPPAVPAVGVVPLYEVPARWTAPDGSHHSGSARA